MINIVNDNNIILNEEKEERKRRGRKVKKIKRIRRVRRVRRIRELPERLQREILEGILRKYGANEHLQDIYKGGNVKGLNIPNRFYRKGNVRSNSSAESLIVTIGEIARTFEYLDLSHCTLSSESLDALGPHLHRLERLDISYCQGIYQWGFLLYMRDNLRSLKASNLFNCSKGQQLCALIGGLSCLQDLDLSYTQLDLSDIIFHFPNLTSLTSLNLIQSKDRAEYAINDEAMGYIIKFTTLHSLALPGMEVSASSVSSLSSFPLLRSLTFSHLIGFSKLSSLSSLTQLTSLAIIHSELDDAIMTGVISLLPSLTSLDVSHNFITGSGVSSLSSLKYLFSLNASHNEIGANRQSDHLSFFHLTNLTDLNLNGNPMISTREWLSQRNAVEHLSFLSRMVNLTSLSINGITREGGLEDTSIQYLIPLCNLSYLSLRKNAFSDNCFQKLKRMTSLKSLDVGENKISNSGMIWLKSCTSLEEINLSHSTISDSGFSHLLLLPKLRKIIAHHTRVTPDLISILEQHFPYIDFIC